jgi:hypothetical protein
MRAPQDDRTTPIPANQRPICVLRLRAEPGIDAVRALRFALKFLLRRLGLKCISIREDTHKEPRHDAQ